MLNFRVSLNRYDGEEHLCAPTILVSEDSSDETCVIIFPEFMETDGMSEALLRLVNDMQGEYETVAQITKLIYGGNSID